MTYLRLSSCLQLLASIVLLLAPAAKAADPFFAGAPPNYLTPRTALVIGIGNYDTMRPLGDNPVNDAKQVTQLLKSMGFNVTLLPEGRRNDVLDKLNDLERTVVRNPGVMLIYYSGHGLSSGGRAFMVPADAKLGSPQDLDDRMIPLDRVYEAVKRANPRQAILIFDACRSDPFAGAANAINIESGLKAAANPPPGMYVAYSTIDNRTASNGALQNSPFTTAFLQFAPDEPTLSEVFTRIRERLVSSLIQQPSSSLDNFVGRFKFTMTQADFASEQEYFERVHKQNFSSMYENFMNVYRSGYFYNSAEELFAKSKEREVLTFPVAPSVPPPSSVLPTPAIPGVTKLDLLLRSLPDPNAPTVNISKGTALVVIGRTNDTYKVALSGGREGYVPQTAVEISSSLEQTKTISLPDNGTLPNTQKIEESGTKAVQRAQTVVVQTTIPSGASSDQATIGLKATLDTVDALLKSGLSTDRLVVSPTVHQGPEFKVKLLNLQN